MDESATAVDQEPSIDPLRTRLLDAAARVIATKGYYDTRIMDVVRESGLSSGALYGRFESKRDLLKAAVVEATLARPASQDFDRGRVVETTVQAALNSQPINDSDALRVEAFVESRRDEEVALAVREARQARRNILRPMVESAVGDQTNPDLEASIDAVLYALETIHLGILLQRSAAVKPVDEDAWRKVAGVMIDSLLDTVVIDSVD